jgi:hypothetical protein
MEQYTILDGMRNQTFITFRDLRNVSGEREKCMRLIMFLYIGMHNKTLKIIYFTDLRNVFGKWRNNMRFISLFIYI